MPNNPQTPHTFKTTLKKLQSWTVAPLPSTFEIEAVCPLVAHLLRLFQVVPLLKYKWKYRSLNLKLLYGIGVFTPEQWRQSLPIQKSLQIQAK